MHINSSANDEDVEVCRDRSASVMSPPSSPSEKVPSIAAPESGSRVNAGRDLRMINKSSSDNLKQGDRSVRSRNSAANAPTLQPDAQKFATPKSPEKASVHKVHVGSEKPPTQHVMVADKLSMPPMPVMSRPLSAPIIPASRPAVSVVSMVHSAPVLARSVSATGRLGPDPTTAPAVQSYVPQSYRNAIVGSPVTANSSAAYTQNHSPGPAVSASISTPLYSPPHSSDNIDPNNNNNNNSQMNMTFSFGMVNHHHHHRDMLQNGPLWAELDNRASLLNDMQNLDLYSSAHGPAHDHLRAGFPALRTSGRQAHALADEFPHLDIINDLLDDDLAVSNSGYQGFSNGPHYLNRHWSFPGDPGMSGGVGPSTGSCRFERTRSYPDEGFQHSYGAPGPAYDTFREVIPQASPRSYANGPIGGLIPNQWQVAGSDLAYLSVPNADGDGYGYRVTDYRNLNAGVNNGYTVFRPSNGL